MADDSDIPWGLPANGKVSSEATIGALETLIRQLLADERPTLERLAPRLGLSVRTLQRRLHVCGRSFEDIADDSRREIAIERISEAAGTITETAFLLGYSDLSHFTRAFRRWTGKAPSEFAEDVRRVRNQRLDSNADFERRGLDATKEESNERN